jgi:signal transduction histidine kinase
MEIVAGLADERSIRLRSRSAAGTLAVRADRERLRQVLINLLGNAIKFTPVGGAVEVVMGSDEILVEDTGDGIPPEQLQFLFMPFHRASTSSTGESGVAGSGLGLALSQRLMQAMDGDLTLVGSSAAGTTFRLVLPSASPVAISQGANRLSSDDDLGPTGEALHRFADAGFDDAVVLIEPAGPSPEQVRALYP